MKRNQEIYKVTLVGGVVNVVLLLFKFVAGIVGHSAAMVADAVHSLSDFVTDVIVLVFIHISGKPKDNWAALLSVLLKEAVYQYSMVKARQLNSQVVAANAWHHRSDALSSIGTAIGIGGAIFLGQRWTVLDPIASVVVGAFIVKVAVDLLRNGIGDLMEQSLPDAVEEEMLRIVRALPGVVNPHDLRTRRIGNHYAIELHILMDGDISLREAHNKASEVEELLRARYGEDTHVAVHVEPKEIISQNLNNQP